MIVLLQLIVMLLVIYSVSREEFIYLNIYSDNWIDNVIGPNGLLSTKARILVTNSVSFVKQFDSLAYIRRGIVLEHGSYKDLAADPTTEIHKLM